MRSVSDNLRLWRLYYNYSPDRNEVIYVTNISNKIIAIDSAGVESVIGYLPYDQFPVNKEAVEKSIVFWENRSKGMSDALRMEILPHEPFYWSVNLSEGQLWVQLTRSDEAKPNWVITSLDGTVLESFHGPVDISNISAVSISGNRIYGSVEDAEGVEYLVGYELVEIGE